MKVKLLTSLSGANGSFGYGEDYECSDKEAYNLIKNGMAEISGKNAEVETKKLYSRISEIKSIAEAEKDIQDRELAIENQYDEITRAEKALESARSNLESKLSDESNAQALANIEEKKQKAEAEAKEKATKKKTTKKASKK